MESSGKLDEAGIEKFERAWATDVPPNIAEFLPAPTEETYLGTLRELVIIDLEFRWKCAGGNGSDAKPPEHVEQYMARFPPLDTAEQCRRLAEEEFIIRRRYGDRPATSAYIARFPQFAELLAKLDAEYPIDSPRPAISTHKSPQQPTVIGNYTIIKELGEGGMGSVYLAQQSAPVRRQVALKVIRRGLDSKDVIARFEAERQALAMMDHQNIARIYQAGTTEQGQPFFAMEYVAGTPLTEYCAEHRLSIGKRLRLFIDICAAVQHAHQKGILHRDLKPTNVLIAAEDGQPIAKVIDFGLAKALDSQELLTDKTVYTHIGQVLGTLKYMSPEQAATHEQDIDTRADVYALGVMLYELLTGDTPLSDLAIRDQGVLSVLEMIRDLEPARPSVKLVAANAAQSISAECGTNSSALRQLLRGDLDWVVMKALEKDRERRYASVSSLADDVRRFLNDEPVLARPPSVSYRLRKFTRKHRLLVTSAVAMLLLLLAGIATSSWQLARAIKAEAFANEQEQIAIAKAEESQRRRIEAEQSRDDEQRARQRATDVLELMVGAFRSTGADGGGHLGMSAEDVLNIARQDLSLRLADDPEARAKVLNALSISYRGLGNYVDAIATAEEAVALSTAAHGEASPETIEALEILAHVLLYAGRDAEATELQNRIIEHYQRQTPPDDLAIAEVKLYLGLARTNQGDAATAIEIIEQSLQVFERELEPTDFWMLSANSGLARAYVKAGQAEKARPILEKTMQAYILKLGSQDYKSHSTALQTLHDLTQCYLQLGEFEPVIEMLEEPLRVIPRFFGKTHPITISLSQQLAKAYEGAERTADAIRMFEETGVNLKLSGNYRALLPVLIALRDLLEKELGPSDIKTIQINLQIGQAYLIQGQYQQAVEVLTNARETSRGALGPESQTTLVITESLALSHANNKQPVEAAAMFAELLRGLEAVNETNRQLILDCQRDLTANLLWSKQYEAAIASCTKWLAALEADGISDTSIGATARAHLASALAAWGKFTEASAAANKSLEIESVTPFDRARCQSILALCAAESNAADETTVQIAAQAFEILQTATLTQQHFCCQWCKPLAGERVVRICDITQDAENAAFWRRKLAEQADK